MNILQRIYMKFLTPLYNYIDSKSIQLQGEIEEKKSQLQEEIEEKRLQLQNEVEGIKNSIQYFSDTMAEKSFLIDTNLEELKEHKFALKRLEIQIDNLYVDNCGGRVLQVVPVLKSGDAVGNYALLIHETLKRAGIMSEIYSYDNKTEYTWVQNAEHLKAGKSDIILLHMAAENDFAELLQAYKAKKVLFYHNITPPQFFKEFDAFAETSTKRGLEQVKNLVGKIDYCFTDSQFNRKDLERIGFTCPIYVVSIPLDNSLLQITESQRVKRMISDGKKNILFVGRVVPNKCLEDVIRSYKKYKEIYEKNVRLILVGNYNEEDNYFKFLEKCSGDEEDILFTKHISISDLVTYYRYASLFLCMSEHEGFCVPLIEAMAFHVPIIAYDSTAISETLGNGGWLVGEKDFEMIAKMINQIMEDLEKREEMKQHQKEIIKRYEIKRFARDIVELISRIAKEEDND